MSKNANKQFICQSCGGIQTRWSGKCDSCGQWNSITEEVIESRPKFLARSSTKNTPSIQLHSLNTKRASLKRHVSNIGELDRVLGGGFVPGSAILVGGDPGIGKSTLLLQTAAELSKTASVMYVSGEEGVDQISMRAVRLKVDSAPVKLANATSVYAIIETIKQQENAVHVLIIDSIQTVYIDSIDSAPGSVTQVRASAFELIRMAKKTGIVVILVGHVTKDGSIAGPRVLEHMVDAVLYFEGERGHPFRILRAVKNRFGATDEIGVFDMSHDGLQQVINPSALFLGDRQDQVAGSCVFAGIEGTRPILTEIQALVMVSTLNMPRRSTVGWDSNRLSMVLAVLESRAGFKFSTCDVYLNIAGGMRIFEPAADLAVACALISALTNKKIPGNLIAFGEIGLTGDIRFVSQGDLRLREAKKLGFTQAIIPERRAQKLTKLALHKHQVVEVKDLKTILNNVSSRPFIT